MPTGEWISRWTELTLSVGLRLIAILVFAWVLRRALRLLTGRVVKLATAQTRMAQAREQQTRTLASLLYSTGSTVIIIAAIITALPLFGVNVTPIATIAGLASLALGFGAQNLVRDVINGFFIVLEDQFAVGDVVSIGEITGRVEELTLRRTVVRNQQGALCNVPNGEIRTLANLSRDWSQLWVDVTLGSDDAVNRVTQTLEAVCSDFRADAAWSDALVDGPRVLGVESLSPAGTILRVQIRTAPTRQHDVARELRRRIKARFEQEGIGRSGVQRVEVVGGTPGS